MLRLFKERRHFVTATGLGLLMLAALGVALAVMGGFGVGRTTKIIETLNSPVKVAGWTTDGLRLDDGRLVELPGVRGLPVVSPALAEVTKRGVEVGKDGTVYGLVRVHHWCGNDPVVEHIVRVDIAEMMKFLRVGEGEGEVPHLADFTQSLDGRFSEFGWRIEGYLDFETWKSMVAAGG